MEPVGDLTRWQGYLRDAIVEPAIGCDPLALGVAGLEKYATRPLRSRAAPPKLVILSNALLAATDARGAPDPAREPERWGAWVENACLAHAVNAGQRVRYWREGPREVDAVLEGSWGDWAVEVKMGGFTARDLAGLLEFARRREERGCGSDAGRRTTGGAVRAPAPQRRAPPGAGPRPEPAARTSRADTGRRYDSPAVTASPNTRRGPPERPAGRSAAGPDGAGGLGGRASPRGTRHDRCAR